MNHRSASIPDSSLLWRIEEACRGARPAASEHPCGGWLLRRSGGATRRTNSASPLPGPRQSDEKLISQIEAYYRSFGQTPIFRVTDFAGEMSIELDRRNYSTQAETRTVLARLADTPETSAEGIEMAVSPGSEWLELRNRLSKDPLIFRNAIAAIHDPVCFASARSEGRVVSIAYGVIHRGMQVVDSVATDPALRGKGLAKRTVGALLRWGRQKGATEACLPVVSDNMPANALYAALGFRTELYRYHYRLAPNP